MYTLKKLETTRACYYTYHQNHKHTIRNTRNIVVGTRNYNITVVDFIAAPVESVTKLARGHHHTILSL